jgi:hypothetical protein
VKRATSLARRERADVCDRSRRTVLNWEGTLAGAVAFGFDPLSLRLTEALAKNGVVDLGTGDIALLNYAYALEQLEAASYTAVMASPYSGMTRYERSVLSDVKGHEIAHREFFRNALGSSRIPELGITFPSVDFGNRGSVLRTASMFEDLGVSAYNGAGALLTSAEHVAAVGTLVSVEARHAAILRDLLSPNSEAFAGAAVVDANGLDVANPPHAVLAKAGAFYKMKISAAHLP